MRPHSLVYAPSTFATAVIYAAVPAAWSLLPDLPPHASMLNLFRQVKLLTPLSFLYGLFCALVYGAFIAIVFVFFYNLWPRVVAIIAGHKSLAS